MHQRFEDWVAWMKSEKGLIQEQVGDLIGCSQVFVSQLAQGLRDAGRDVALAVETESSKWPSGPIRASEWSASSARSAA